jgi:hypothetical protein
MPTYSIKKMIEVKTRAEAQQIELNKFFMDVHNFI